MTDPKNLDEALLILQADPPVLTKSKAGQVGNQKTKYADLPQVNAVVLSRLNALGVIWKTKPTVHTDEPRFRLAWELKHVASGTAEVGDWPLKLSENPQQMGSAVTYARRYALLAVTGIAAEDEDDDGAAGRQTAQRAHQAARQRPAPAADQGGQEMQRGQRQQSAAARPALPGEKRDGMSPAQRGMMMAAFGKLNIEREDRLQMSSSLVGRKLTSANDMTSDEVRRLLDDLDKALAEPDPQGYLVELMATRAQGGGL